MHPGQTGIDLAIKLRRKGMDVTTSTGQREHRRVKELFAPYTPVPPAEASNTERDLDWSRVPSEQERQLPYLHAYDRGGSYMAGAASLEFSIGEPVHHPDDRPFDKRLPGYWLIDVPENGDWRLPNPLAPGGTKAPDHPIWVTTPPSSSPRPRATAPRSTRPTPGPSTAASFSRSTSRSRTAAPPCSRGSTDSHTPPTRPTSSTSPPPSTPSTPSRRSTPA